MNWIAMGLFVLGVVLAALGLTFVTSKALLLSGIIIAAAGLLYSNLFRR
jgi:uncharacterized membrane protein YoaK (UPF0700 family)